MSKDNGRATNTKPPKVPRITFAVTALDDPDYIRLVSTPDGQRAFGLFLALILAARNAGNQGVFQVESSVLAMLVRWNLADFESAMDTLATAGRDSPWVVKTETGYEIPSYGKWQTNPNWGGARAGAGRPPRPDPVDKPPVTEPAEKSSSPPPDSSFSRAQLEKPTRFTSRARARARVRGEVSEVKPFLDGSASTRPAARSTLTSPHLSQAEDFRTAAAALATLERAAAEDDARASPLRPDQRQGPLAALSRLGWTPEYLRDELIPAIRRSEQAYMVNPAKLLRDGGAMAADFERRLMGVAFADRDAEMLAELKRLDSAMGEP